MTDRPISFSAPMVQALLAGRKTMTRRLVKLAGRLPDGAYRAGDRLYVREAFQGHAAYEAHGYKPSNWGNKPIWYCADGEPDPLYSSSSRRRPSIHMPRWASRLTLTVTEVRVQRLQDISHDDVRAEGVEVLHHIGHVPPFHTLWNSLHGPEAWEANPWVVALTFTVAKGNIDA